MGGTKRCPKCGEVKPADEFFRSSSSIDGLQSYCRSCAKDYNSTWYVPEHAREKKLKKRYGITKGG